MRIYLSKYGKNLIIVAITLTLLTIIYIYSFLPRSSDDITNSEGVETSNTHWKWGNKCYLNEENKRILGSLKRDIIEASKTLDSINRHNDDVLKVLGTSKDELEVYLQRIEEAKLQLKELSDRRNVKISLPFKSLYPSHNSLLLHKTSSNDLVRSIDEAFDFSRCSISSHFPVYVYPKQATTSKKGSLYLDELKKNEYVTSDPFKACLFVLIPSKQFNDIQTIKYGQGNGKNHLILNIDNIEIENRAASIVVNDVVGDEFKSKLDLFTYFPDNEVNLKEYWKDMPALLPHSRKFLISFVTSQYEFSRFEIDRFNLLKNSSIEAEDSIFIDVKCASPLESKEKFVRCGTKVDRIDVLQTSVFTLIFPNSKSFASRLNEALRSGTIPVIMSMSHPLPFDNFIDWRSAAIRIPYQRFPELHFILKSISLPDILEYRRKGRFYLENYLLSPSTLIKTIVSAIRFQTLTLGLPDKEVKAEPLFGTSFISPIQSVVPKQVFEEEFLGHVEAPFASPPYLHNFTSMAMYSHNLWNTYPHLVHHTPSYLIEDAVLPSEAEFFEETSIGMRPIGPGTGIEFSKALGGNRVREQFTIVMVTYNRDQVLYSSLERLHQMPYLNKIIIVWNNVGRAPPTNWPHLHVPIVFVNATKNSLNNRFYPYNEIETEAVFSMDDDIDIKQHEIMLAFRVWREQRMKIIGFPARYHARFKDQIFYNSNHTCQLSMILTGASFLHKSYLHAYTYLMPQIIRDTVDENMNCEDLAMNFLVSHLIRQPPVKTTSKWTLKCQKCTETLSGDESHFVKRHQCIRFFTKVYGYNPLLFTQFRADSVLFKTRLPHNHQKCFRYV